MIGNLRRNIKIRAVVIGWPMRMIQQNDDYV